MNENTTIVGIATPPGNSGVGIVRISGADALQIISKMFSKKRLSPRSAVLGTIRGDGFSDTALAIYFKAPNSFTGENIVELQCHGGYFLLQKVMETAIAYGAQAAGRGEFSRRAFLNGKLSLDQAEAIIEIINAESSRQLENANGIFAGQLRQKLDAMERALVETTAQIEATLEYPEHDIEHATVKEITPKITNIAAQVKVLLDTAREGKMISHGITVAVLGKPNVGKSSIFNALLGIERSIVTDIAGTTTDTVSHSILYNGIKLNFVDTAGIREGGGKIETLGIERTKQALTESDIALAVFDISTPPDDYDKRIVDLVKDFPCVYALNKNDLESGSKNLAAWKSILGEEILLVSAKSGENTNEIKKQIFEKATSETRTENKTNLVITNARHAAELASAATALDDALTALENTTLDCVAADIGTALNHLGNITGTRASEAVLDEIFSRFCLGK